MANPAPSPSLSALHNGPKTIICCPDEVSPEPKALFQDCVRIIKEYTDPEDSVTDDELKMFLTMVFSRWTTADVLTPPPKKPLVPKLEDIAVNIGILTEDAPTPEVSRRLNRLRRSGRQHIQIQEPLGFQQHPERKAGAPIYMRTSMALFPTIQLVDSKSRCFSENTVKFRYHEGLNQRVARFLAMKQLDDYCFYQVHRYNVHLTVYFARKWLKLWATGVPLAEILEWEDAKHYFYEFRLFRNTVSSDSRMDPAGRLCALPRPRLFDLP
ncbi:hypothetical protein MaudCBS49596_000281 [Microsporum audouinii]